MKRLHIHLAVRDLDQSIAFYAALFGKEPDKRRDDYAKWLLDEPSANISISKRAEGAGVDHVGLQFDNDETLESAAAALKAARQHVAAEEDATCCYARSNKFWARSPEGAVWELFHTFGDSETYGASRPDVAVSTKSAACCVAAS